MENWEETIEKVARELYQRKMQGPVSPDMVKAIAQDLMGGVFQGYGKSFDTKGLAVVDFEMLKAVEQNVFVFSGFKNYQQLREASNLLKDADGNIRGWEDFWKDFKHVDKTYNKTYAKVEHQTAVSTADGISRWNKYQADKAVIPFLRWRTAPGENTCPVCGALNDTWLPVDHPFWKTRWYPVHFGCLCLVSQENSADGLTPEEKIPSPEYPPKWEMFRHNAGIDGVVFPKEHAYYEANEKAKKQVRTAALELIVQKDKAVLMNNSSFRYAMEAVHDEDLLEEFTELNEVEAAALRGYTGSGYYDINKALRNGKPDKQTQLWAHYINSALAKFEVSDAEEVYRGVIIRRTQLQKYSRAFRAGTSIIEKAFVSTSARPGKATDFIGSGGDGTVKVFFTVIHKDGRSIKSISAHTSEDEVLIKSKSRFNVVGYEKEGTGAAAVYNIMLEQIE